MGLPAARIITSWSFWRARAYRWHCSTGSPREIESFRCSAGYRNSISRLGALKNGSVFSPLFSAFGPEPIKARMSIGNAKVLVNSEAFYRRKIEPWRKELASLEHVFLTDSSATPPPGTTGRPKGAVHVHEAVVAHHITGRLALDLRPDDVFRDGLPAPPTASSRRSPTAPA